MSVVKAPYSVSEIGVFIFLSGSNFPRNRRFLSDSAKAGSAGAERFRMKSYVLPALSIGIWMRPMGLPVLAGDRRVCLFLFSVRTELCSRLQATVFELPR